MGGGGGVGARAPSHAAYYVALAGVLVLLLLLLLYFAYFCVKRVKELVQEEYKSPTPTPPSYPVQPVIRDGARAMARLVQHLPSDTVLPTPQPNSTTLKPHSTTLQPHSTTSQPHSSTLQSHSPHPTHPTHHRLPAHSTDPSTCSTDLSAPSGRDLPPPYEHTQPPSYQTVVPSAQGSQGAQ